MTHGGTFLMALSFGVVMLAGCDEQSGSSAGSSGGGDEESVSSGGGDEETCEARVEKMKERIASDDTDFDVPESAEPWVKDKADEVRAATEPGQRAPLIAEGMSKSIHGCADLVNVFKSIAVMPADEKDAAFKREAPKAIASCDCEGVDVDAFETFARLSVAMEP